MGLITLDKFSQAQKIHNFLPWVACKHHKTHKNDYLNFETHNYQTQIYHDKSDYIVIKKSTQNGISEYLLLRALSHAIKGMRVFYVLPTFELVKRFVDERYTKSVQNTPYYRLLAKATKDELNIRQTDSVKSKDIGQGNIAFVNSFSPIGFTEYPADEVIIDELDRCDQDNIKMAWERLSHSEYRWQTKISNPTFKNFGIDAEYNDTDRMEYLLKCESGHYVNIDWYKHVVRQTDDKRYVIKDPDWTWNSQIDIRPICDKCNKPINRNKHGEWVPLYEKQKRGYEITKLFTGTVTYVELMDRFIQGLKDDEAMQRFQNADLGKAYTADGATITTEMLQDCVQDYNPQPENGLILAGIDVGKYYNYVIKKVIENGKLKTIGKGKVKDTDQLLSILSNYKISAGVIDGLPETRESRKIASRFKFMFLCYFGGNKKDGIDLQNKTVTVQRTPAIDAVKEALLTNTIIYPHNYLSDREFVSHMTSSVRVFNKDKRMSGQTGAYEWVEDGPDHYLLATAYCLIARRLIALLTRK